MRESHPHRDLFYFSEYPDSIPNFFDRSIYRHLSRELVFESVSLLPLLGEPTPAMVNSFSPEPGLGTAGLPGAGGQPVDHLHRPA